MQLSILSHDGNIEVTYVHPQRGPVTHNFTDPKDVAVTVLGLLQREETKSE